MDFKAARIAAGLTLAQAAEKSGYSIGAINGQELKHNGSARLKFKLAQIYGIVPDDAVVIGELREAPVPYRVAAPPPAKKIDVAKLRRSVKNIRSQLDQIESTLEEL